MSKMEELMQAVSELRACSEKLVKATIALQNCIAAEQSAEVEQPSAESEPTAEPTQTTETTPVESPKTFTFVDVRKAFSAKSHAGYTELVKSLITKYGTDKLSGVQEKDYPALMADLEAIG